MNYILLLGVLLVGCGASAMPSDTLILQKADQAAQIAQELCLLAHATNARVNAEPQLSIMRAKIQAVCDPALDALDTASATSAVNLLTVLRKTISELMQ